MKLSEKLKFRIAEQKCELSVLNAPGVAGALENAGV